MYKRTVATLLLIQFTFVNYSQQQYNNQPVSPCPQIFEYRYDGNDWFGVITTNAPRLDQKETVLQLTLSLRASTTQNNVGAISLYDSSQETTNNIIHQRPVRYRVRFPFRYPIPKVVQIGHDSSIICVGSAEDPNAGGVVSRIELKHVMNTFTSLYSGDGQSQPPEPPQPQPQQPAYEYQPQPQQPVYQPQPQPQPQQPVYQPQPQPQPQQPVYRPQNRPQTSPTLPQPQAPPTTSPADSQNENEACGQRQSDVSVGGFIYGGENTSRGDWPWIVAIFLNKPTGLSFICGGTLISSRAIVTAAHCIITSQKAYQPNEMTVWLGRYSLTDWAEPGATTIPVQELHVHPDYMKQAQSFDADVAVIVLQRQAMFSRYIRPICLWPLTATIGDVEGKMGSVIGWGRDADFQISTIPKKVDLPIVNTLTCIQKSEHLAKTVSHRTFCAGSLDGTGPCRGDSGGGFSLLRQNRWTLRGIVSAGLNDINTGGCKLIEYVVFTDVAKFTDWIRPFM